MKTIDELNQKYAPLSPAERISALYTDFTDILLTSSFGTTSAVLLHMFSASGKNQKVYFLDTTYHFAETIEYKNSLTKQLKLDVEIIRPEEWKNNFTNSDQTWSKDPDLCCSINKVEPLEKIKANFQIWVSGLMQSQNSYRKQMNIFEKKGDIIKFYPIIDFTEQQAKEYIMEHQLPEHPLVKHGFNSVGCIHCTVKGRGREGRWVNRSKTECGLHI